MIWKVWIIVALSSQRGFMCASRGFTVWWHFNESVSWNRNHGIHMNTHTHNQKHTSLSLSLSPSHLWLVERWRPDETLLSGSSSVSHPHPHPINLSQGEPPSFTPPIPLVHLEPVCASLGRPCPAQTNKPLEQRGTDEGMGRAMEGKIMQRGEMK